MTESKRMDALHLEHSGPCPERFPVGSLESRASARALLGNGRTAPHLIIVFCEASASGPIRCDATHARIEGGELPSVEIVREPGETPEEFEERVKDYLPVRGAPRGVFFLGPDDEPAT
jgi:hypothetical protein